MAKLNHEALLARAEKKFLAGDYDQALLDFALVLKEYPASEEARVGVYLSDLASENDQEAQALFDYYQLIKDERPNAAEIIDEIIESIDEAKEKITRLAAQSLQEDEESEGIEYQDFKKAVADRGSFKRTLEDIMFSTKVVISEKNEFIDFIENLIAEGYVEEARGYLESTASMIEYDRDILALYNKAFGKGKE